MDESGDIREFLVSRRARITPQQAGLPADGTHRRVHGLRREEDALLAGISTECYKPGSSAATSEVSQTKAHRFARTCAR